LNLPPNLPPSPVYIRESVPVREDERDLGLFSIVQKAKSTVFQPVLHRCPVHVEGITLWFGLDRTFDRCTRGEAWDVAHISQGKPVAPKRSPHRRHVACFNCLKYRRSIEEALLMLNRNARRFIFNPVSLCVVRRPRRHRLGVVYGMPIFVVLDIFVERPPL
jgi:hypothetical protein